MTAKLQTRYALLIEAESYFTGIAKRRLGIPVLDDLENFSREYEKFIVAYPTKRIRVERHYLKLLHKIYLGTFERYHRKILDALPTYISYVDQIPPERRYSDDWEAEKDVRAVTENASANLLICEREFCTVKLEKVEWLWRVQSKTLRNDIEMCRSTLSNLKLGISHARTELDRKAETASTKREFRWAIGIAIGSLIASMIVGIIQISVSVNSNATTAGSVQPPVSPTKDDASSLSNDNLPASTRIQRSQPTPRAPPSR